MLKNSKVVLFVTLKSWSGQKLLDPTTYILAIYAAGFFTVIRHSVVLSTSLYMFLSCNAML